GDLKQSDFIGSYLEFVYHKVHGYRGFLPIDEVNGGQTCLWLLIAKVFVLNAGNREWLLRLRRSDSIPHGFIRLSQPVLILNVKNLSMQC
ncbi:MAG: hypothetical protein US67_C0046G0011, partial [Candidatus Woesebacteria bacterium GW2011_GWD1_38_10]